jgi:PmbA protein
METLYSLRKRLLEKGAQDIVLTKSESDESMIKFVNNKIVKTGLETSKSVDIFVAQDKKLVSTSLKEFDDATINKTVQKIIDFLKTSQKNHSYVGIPENKFTYSKIENSYDPKIENLDPIEIVDTSINAALKNSKRTAGIFQSSTGKVSILTSTGIEKESKSSSLYLSLRAFATKEASGHKTATSSILRKFNFEKAGKEAGEIATMALNPEEGTPGEYDVIFSPLAFASILDNIGDASSIFNVEAGMSFLHDKLNENLGKFDLIDNGILQNGVGSSSFDAEGHPTQRTEVIKDGVLKTYLHNTSSAIRHDVKSTGNAGIISPSATNLVLTGKEGNPFNIDKGIYVTNVWYTRFQNYTTGDFSTIPRDGMFMIKNSEIGKPIKNLRVSENVLNMLKNIEKFGKDKEQITSWEADTPCNMAPLLIKNVRMTKPTA